MFHDQSGTQGKFYSNQEVPWLMNHFLTLNQSQKLWLNLSAIIQVQSYWVVHVLLLPRQPETKHLII